MAGRRSRGALASRTARAAVVTSLGGLSLAVLWLVADTTVAAPQTPITADAAAATQPTEHVQPASSVPPVIPPLAVHVRMPRSVPIGSDRRLSVTVWDQAPVDEDRQAENLWVSFASEDARFSVRPAVVLVTRGRLADERFAIAARADLRCGEETTGAIEVTVTSLRHPDRSTSTRVGVPQLDCRDAPPAAPQSVHVIAPVCGRDHAEQVDRLLGGEELDPRRCAADRWRDGEPRPWPPPRPTPRPAPAPARPAPPPPPAESDEVDDPDGDRADDSSTDERDATTDDPANDGEDAGGRTSGDADRGDRGDGDRSDDEHREPPAATHDAP